MKTIIDNKTGILICIPENENDTNLIFHLVNCSELTRFTEYIEQTELCKPITEDLGLTVDQFDDYPGNPFTSTPISLDTGETVSTMPLRLRDGFREIAVRPIGFNRDSS